MRLFITGIALVISALFGSQALAARSPAYKSPRTEFGKPDLQGVWNYGSVVPLERAKKFAEREFLTPEEQTTVFADTQRLLDQFLSGPFGMDKFWLEQDLVENDRSSLIVYPRDGRVPKLAPGVQRIGGMTAAMYDVKGTQPVRFMLGGIGKRGPEDRGLSERCIVSMNAPPFMPLPFALYLQIAQSKDHVMISTEANHDTRIIPLDGRSFVDDRVRAWSGDSRGYWEGDTLVVVTKNFNGLTQSFFDAGTSYDKVVTERFTRVSDSLIQYEATVEDPKTFQDKIVLKFPMKRSDAKIYEDACHEGNYSMAAILAGARKQEEALDPK